MGKHKCPEFENHERWLVSYADMVTLLFAVFVVLYALKEDGEKVQDASGSMEESFNKPLEDIPPSQRIGPQEAGFGVFDHLKGESIKPTVIKKFPNLEEQSTLIENEMNRVKGQIELRLYGEEKFRKQQDDPGVARIVSVVKTRHGFKVRLLAHHFYEPRSTDIKPTARKELDTVINTLKELGREIRVEGHTDSEEARTRSNWDISALRATHVLRYMVEKHTFPPSLLSAAGFGDTKPIASNATDKSRKLNRRIEFTVKYDTENSLDPDQ